MNTTNLHTKLWNIVNILRSRMDANDYKNYMLGFIFFKHLSDKLELEFIKSKVTLEQINEFDEIKLEKFKNIFVDEIGYYFNPKYLFSNLIEKINNGEKSEIIEFLNDAFNEITDSTIGKESKDDFRGLFSDIDLNSNKLGNDDKERQNVLSKILIEFDAIDWSEAIHDSDVLGDAYEYLISMFASSAGKKGGEFYTPFEVSEVLAKLVISQDSKIKIIYDPTCGSGSLLIKTYKELLKNKNKKYTKADINSIKIKGQEINHTTFNLARMNMFLHGINYDKFNIRIGDTIRTDKFYDEKIKFNAIVANPPFGTKWDPKEKDYLVEDERFSKYGKLAPASRAEFTFVQHMLFHLHDDGLMATVLPHGVLFRGGTEGEIRKYIIKEDNYLDAIIGLPSNLFFGTGIPAIILVFKKCRKTDENVLFIDASKGFEKVKNQNKLREKDIKDIIDTYVNRKEIDKNNNDYDLISRNVPVKEIEENDFNLNISRYVDDYEEVEHRELSEIEGDLKKLKEEEIKLDEEIQRMMKEMGIK